MGWEFCTDADFEEKLEWTRVFVRDEEKLVPTIRRLIESATSPLARQ